MLFFIIGIIVLLRLLGPVSKFKSGCILFQRCICIAEMNFWVLHFVLITNLNKSSNSLDKLNILYWRLTCGFCTPSHPLHEPSCKHLARIMVIPETEREQLRQRDQEETDLSIDNNPAILFVVVISHLLKSQRFGI